MTIPTATTIRAEFEDLDTATTGRIPASAVALPH